MRMPSFLQMTLRSTSAFCSIGVRTAKLERSGASAIRPLAPERAMPLAQYNLSRLRDRIACDGYIKRRAGPDDARGQVVQITARGSTAGRCDRFTQALSRRALASIKTSER
jgi:hypothetical protein